MSKTQTKPGAMVLVPRESIHLVFDRMPDNEGCTFIEAEDSSGKSISAGEWRNRADGYVELVVPVMAIEQPPAVGGEPEVIAIIESALRRSFSLGQIYWQQADSDSTCQQNKSDQTMEVQAQHILMVVESLRKLFKAQPVTAKVVLPERMEVYSAIDTGWNLCLDEVAKLNGGA